MPIADHKTKQLIVLGMPMLPTIELQVTLQDKVQAEMLIHYKHLKTYNQILEIKLQFNNKEDLTKFTETTIIKLVLPVISVVKN